jgi:hypothetical protein
MRDAGLCANCMTRSFTMQRKGLSEECWTHEGSETHTQVWLEMLSSGFSRRYESCGCVEMWSRCSWLASAADQWSDDAVFLTPWNSWHKSGALLARLGSSPWFRVWNLSCFFTFSVQVSRQYIKWCVISFPILFLAISTLLSLVSCRKVSA